MVPIKSEIWVAARTLRARDPTPAVVWAFPRWRAGGIRIAGCQAIGVCCRRAFARVGPLLSCQRLRPGAAEGLARCAARPARRRLRDLRYDGSGEHVAQCHAALLAHPSGL